MTLLCACEKKGGEDEYIIHAPSLGKNMLVGLSVI